CISVINGDLSTGGLAACTLLTGRAFQPLQGAAGFWARMQSIKVAEDRVETLLALPQGLDSVTADNKHRIQQGKIEAIDLSIQLASSDSKILSRINFVAEAGEVIALTGANGSGKSSLLSVLRGLTRPTEGEVRIDDLPITEYTSEEIESNVILLPQYEAIFDGSILDNLTMHRSEFDYLAFEVAEELGFADVVQQLPDGFQTSLGPGGVVLPRGMAQRIAIGRALVNMPKILLFDEANSAVDDASDQAIKRMIELLRGSCTIVLVTHRPSYMWLADRVHALTDGELESDGLTVAGM
ncbi:MAG: ATP-binding cassette domain-containing protein, partial [Pseudomonadota bacterium]